MTARKKKPPAKKKKTGGGADGGGFRPGRLLIRLGWLAFWAVIILTVSQFIWPNVGRLAEENPETTALIEARQEEAREAGRPFTPVQRFVGYDNISPYLIQAVLIAEDDSFFSHSGFDLAMIKRAIEKNLDAGRLKYGASTITQQLAKNLWLSLDKTWLRKFREAIYTWRLERALPKKRILELYLNVVEWGPDLFGAEAAARHYFHKKSAELSPLEAARLAAALPNPRRYRADAASGYVPQRARRILQIMRRRGLGVIWR